METLDLDAMARDAKKALNTIGLAIGENVLVRGLPVGYMLQHPVAGIFLGDMFHFENVFLLRWHSAIPPLILDGKTNGIVDDAVIRETIAECAGHFTEGIEMTIKTYEENSREGMEGRGAALEGVNGAFLKDLADQGLLHAAVGAHKGGVLAVLFY